MLCIWVQMRDSYVLGRYRMARGWRYIKLSLSSVLLLFIFLWHVMSCRCSFFYVFFSCSRWSFVDDDIPLIFSCPADHVHYRIDNRVYFWVWLRPDRLMWRTHTHTHAQGAQGSSKICTGKERVCPLCRVWSEVFVTSIIGPPLGGSTRVA